MCIIFLLYQVHPTYPLIIASNRDETFDRPTESMKLRTQKYTKCCAVQEEQNDEKQQQQHRRGRRRSSLAGKDLVGGGTWLAIDVSSAMQQQQTELDGVQNINDASAASTPSLPRWIAITNFREHEEHGRPSRGGLLTDYIEKASKSDSSASESSEEELQSAQEFVSNLQHVGHEYNGFNMLVGDESGIYYYGNRMNNDDGNNHSHAHAHAHAHTPATDDGEQLRPLTPGIYGLSNALLDTPWPKIERGKELLEQLLRREQQQMAQSNNDSNDKNNDNLSLKQLHEELMTILTDTHRPANDSSLPNTEVGLENERFLSSIFIPPGIFMGKEYGTRSSTTVIVDAHGNVSALERTWYPVDQEDEWFYFHQ